MNRHLLDLNTLLALLDPLHVFHEAAHRWVEATPGLRFLTCPLVQNGVIRIASQSAYPNALGTAAEARDDQADDPPAPSTDDAVHALILGARERACVTRWG